MLKRNSIFTVLGRCIPDLINIDDEYLNRIGLDVGIRELQDGAHNAQLLATAQQVLTVYNSWPPISSTGTLCWDFFVWAIINLMVSTEASW